MNLHNKTTKNNFGMSDETFKRKLRRNPLVKEQIIKHRNHDGSRSLIEKLAYEIKPLFYTGFGIFMLISQNQQAGALLKIAILLVTFFGLYITYCRLQIRKII